MDCTKADAIRKQGYLKGQRGGRHRCAIRSFVQIDDKRWFCTHCGRFTVIRNKTYSEPSKSQLHMIAQDPECRRFVLEWILS